MGWDHENIDFYENRKNKPHCMFVEDKKENCDNIKAL